MNKPVLLVSESQIKQQSIVEKNVDSKLLSKVIINVQELSLKGILGAELYDLIINAVNEKVINDVPLSESFTILLNQYIQPYLIHAVLADFIVINNYKISNKGVMKLNDNSATNATADDIEYVKNYIDNYVVSYKKNLVQYLSENNLSGTCKVDTNITSGSIGWFLN